MDIKPNQNKKLKIEIEGEYFYRYPIKAHLITKNDDIMAIARKYLKDIVRRDDLVIFSKRIISITQNRFYKKNEIVPSKLAKTLANFVKKTNYGASLRTPETMQLAIEEIGKFKIILAAALSALSKPFRIKGVFYKITGDRIRAISGPAEYIIPPYHNYYFKCPQEPNKLAQEISQLLGCQVAIISACDLGVDVLGASDDVNREIVKKIFKDNPLGQSCEQTPIAIVRRERPGEEL